MSSAYSSTVSDRRSPARFAARRRALLKLGFIAPVVIFIVLMFAYPLAQNIVISFENYTTTSFYTGAAPYVGFANYSAVIHDPLFSAALWNTVTFTVVSLAFQFGIGLGLAVFFSRRFPLNAVLRSLLLLPWLLPLVVSGTVFRWMFATNNGVIDQALVGLHIVHSPIEWLSSTTWALTAVIIVNIWVGVPFNMVILYGGLQGIPESLYEAAALDGANAWQRFRYISLPMLRPVTVVVLTLGLIYTIKVFDVIMVVTGGGPANASQTLTIWAYNLSFVDFLFGRGAALGNMLILTALVFAAVYLWAIRAGRGAGAQA